MITEQHDIDKIMKEIEDLEKNMTGSSQSAPAAATEPMAQNTTETTPTDNVLSLKVKKATPVVEEVSMVETDAVPVTNEPLFKSSSSTGDGNMSLKIGGCADVSLEFEKSGMTVTLSYSDSGLVITTDQGAEFRIPFNKKAA